jgi:hypothetical protein
MYLHLTWPALAESMFPVSHSVYKGKIVSHSASPIYPLDLRESMVTTSGSPAFVVANQVYVHQEQRQNDVKATGSSWEQIHIQPKPTIPFGCDCW